MNKLFYMVDMQLQFLEKNKHLIDINETQDIYILISAQILKSKGFWKDFVKISLKNLLSDFFLKGIDFNKFVYNTGFDKK